MLINTGIFIGYNLLYGLTGGIDNAAHIGGLLSGLMLGYTMYVLFKNQLVKQPETGHQYIVDELNARNTNDTIS